jgi:ADP-ribose pyrophosphatase
MASMSDRILCETPYLRFVDRDGWYFVQRPHGGGVVLIVPVTDDGRLVLIEQHRPAVGGLCIELPAGLVGDEEGLADEPRAQAAERELLEEAGYSARELRELVTCASSPGLSSELITFYLATGLTKTGDGGGVGSESILVHEVPLADVEAWLEARARDGRIINAKVYAGLWFASRTPPGR